MEEKINKSFVQIQREEALKYFEQCLSELRECEMPDVAIFDYIHRKGGRKEFYAHIAKKAGYPIIKKGGKFYIEI